jgi:hypothetical protein
MAAEVYFCCIGAERIIESRERPGLERALDAHPAVAAAVSKRECQLSAPTFQKVQLASLLSNPRPAAKPAQERALREAHLKPDFVSGSPELSDWLLTAFAYQLPRGLHRWLAWGPRQAKLAAACPPIIMAALAHLNPAPLAGCLGSGAVQSWPPPCPEAAALRTLMLSAHQRGVRTADMMAIFRKLDLQSQILFCAGAACTQASYMVVACTAPHDAVAW